MATPHTGPSDEQVEQVMGNLLRIGVITAAAIVAAGGVLYLIQYGLEPANHRSAPPPSLEVFQGEPPEPRGPIHILKFALTGHRRGIVQLGLLLLIATPVARVVFSVFAFARQRDWTYVVITLIVLGVLLYSLFSGYLAPQLHGG